MRKLILFLCICIFSFASAQNQNPKTLFEQANSLYKADKYNEAIKKYKEIESEDYISDVLYFNMGNTYYKLNQIAPSIYYYEKALKVNPNNKEAKNNLVFANRLALDKIEEVPNSVLENISDNFIMKFNYNQWAWIAVVGAFVCAIFFLIYYFSYTSKKKLLFFNVSIFAFIVFGISFFFAIKNHSLITKTKEAIIFSEKIPVKESPKMNSETLYDLHEGTKVLVIDSMEDGWSKIKIANGSEGWVQSESFREF
ncbi:tetratricopeptide repeat protein [Aureivirga sp. CE67]|uniref:tetratricopeptide repeat protein n=1 Tax=Aureivirga sp. CE67 TaxID=1788983 RepID=UPI0018CA2AA2|nr:tetratricopeptide repeat protein [Aureivirga sp. CE67]